MFTDRTKWTPCTRLYSCSWHRFVQSLQLRSRHAWIVNVSHRQSAGFSQPMASWNYEVRLASFIYTLWLRICHLQIDGGVRGVCQQTARTPPVDGQFYDILISVGLKVDRARGITHVKLATENYSLLPVVCYSNPSASSAGIQGTSVITFTEQ